MSFTPYTTPIQFEYKPLNLAAFAAPLGKMQEQFDLMQATVESTDFDISNLPFGTDPERAKELLATARSKRDELATNLLQTKNYRQAAIKLKELNRTWAQDPERLALEGEAKRWAEMDKAQRERIDNGKDDQITRNQYLQWRADEIRKYEQKGGASFTASAENPEGTWNRVTTETGRLADLEEELDAKVLEVASKLNSDSFETALRAIGIDQDTQDKLFKKEKVEQLTQEKVASAVRGYLLTQPRFQDWGREVAKYDFKDILNSGNYTEYAQSILQNSLADVDSKIAIREKKLKDVKGNKDADPIYQRLLAEKQQINDQMTSGEYNPELVEREYIDQHLQRMNDMSAVGKVFAFKKVDTEDVARAIPQVAAGDGSALAGGAADAIITPNKFENFSVNSLNKAIYSNVDKMLPELQKVGNIGGGAARTIFLGQKGSETREKNSKNIGAYRDRIERGLSIFTDLKKQGVTSSTEFYKALNRAGIKATQADAKKLWNDLSSEGSGSLTLMQNALNNTAQAAYDYQDAKEIQNNVLEALKDSKEVKAFITDKSNTYYSVNSDDLTTAQVMQLKSLGASVNRTGQTGELIISATPNQLAKIGGFKNAKDAINNGFNFYGVGVFDGSTTGQFMQKLLDNQLTKKEISKRLTGNKEIDNYVNNQFLNVSDLGTFKSAFGTWDPEIFDEQGNLKPGVTLDIKDNRNAKINFHGNTTYFETPVKITTENGVVEKMAYLVPKTGSQAFIQRALNYATSVTDSRVDNLQKQTNDVAHTYSFNNRYKNTLSPQTFESTEVSKGGSVPLLTIPNVAPGANLYVKKEYPMWQDSSGKKYYGQEPVMHIYINDQIYVDPNTGKPYYTTNTNAVKATINRQLPQ